METLNTLLLNEDIFNSFLPDALKEKSNRFFTPEYIAIQSAKWLSGEDKRKVLDIGAGAGKFCLYGAYHTQSHFFGVEMRSHLVKIAENVFKQFNLTNATVLHGNITDFQFSEFEAFYHYNPFQENLAPDLRMDDSILLARRFYYVYRQHTYVQLSLAKKGTRLVTYHGTSFDVPPTYKVIEEFENGDLKYWVKQE